MSVEATRWAIDEAPDDIGGSAMSVLLVMADLANGARWWQVWIPRDEIARRARVSPATAGSALHTLVEHGVISRVEPDDRHPEVRKTAHRTVVWKLNLDGPIRQDLADRNPCKRQNPTSLTLDTGVSDRASPLIPRTQEERKAARDVEKARKTEARSIVSAWWEATTPRPMVPFIAAVKIVGEALKAGWSRDQTADALRRVEGTLVKWKLEEALTRANPRDTGARSDPQEGMQR